MFLLLCKDELELLLGICDDCMELLLGITVEITAWNL